MDCHRDWSHDHLVYMDCVGRLRMSEFSAVLRVNGMRRNDEVGDMMVRAADTIADLERQLAEKCQAVDDLTEALSLYGADPEQAMDELAEYRAAMEAE